MIDRKFKRVLIVLFLAIIIGCIYVYPDIRFIYELKNNYHGITMTANNDELRYLGRINTFYKGNNFTLSDFDNYEHKRQPWTLGFFPEVFLGSIGKSLKISVVHLDILMSFALPAILFILIYNLTLKLSDSPNLSLMSSAVILLGYHIFTGKADILKNIFYLTYSEPLWFLRPISPQFNHIILILTLLFAYKGLNSKKSFTLWVSGLLLGLLFYTFLYSWTFILVGLAVLAFIFIIRKEFYYVRRIIFIMFLSLIISIPYWINFWRLIHFPHYHTLEYFYNVIYSRIPILPLSHIILTLFILLTYYGKKRDFSFWYIMGFLIGGFICVNQHLISGKVLVPGHWLGYSNKTFLIMALFSSLKNFKENYFLKKIINYSFIRRLIVCLILFILVILAFSQQNNFYNMHKSSYTQKQSLYLVFSWLKEHSEKNDVILTDPFNDMRDDFPLPDDVMVYSNNFSFLPATICFTIRSIEEIENRYLIGLALFGYTPEEAEGFFKYNNGVHFLGLRAIKEYGGKGMQPEYFNHLKKNFALFQNEQEIFSTLKRYRLNYIIVGKDKRFRKGIFQKFDRNLLKAYDDDKFVIFKFNYP